MLTESQELLLKARTRYSRRELASRLRVSSKTVARWERGETTCPPLAEPALLRILDSEPTVTHSGDHHERFTFIDLFAGIGGIRLGFEAAGGECIFTSEWNAWAKKTYIENFGDHHTFVGDIVPYPAEAIPDHDVLLAGFPCQPFSLAGVSKKNSLGIPHGFECTTQGTLFYDVQRIIEAKRPRAFMLENVKNLLSHDKGNTFRTIYHVLTEQLGYHVQFRVIDGRNFVPQHRERIIITGFREKNAFNFGEVSIPKDSPVMRSVLHPENGTEAPESHYTVGEKADVDGRYVLSDNLWRYLQDYAVKHRAAGNGFGYGLVTPDSVSRTLSARYHKDGSEILVDRGPDQNPRRLTPRECARLMGFPDDFRIPVSDTQAYRQFGNSVVVPVMEAVATAMRPYIIRSRIRDRILHTGQQTLPIFD